MARDEGANRVGVRKKNDLGEKMDKKMNNSRRGLETSRI